MEKILIIEQKMRVLLKSWILFFIMYSVVFFIKNGEKEELGYMFAIYLLFFFIMIFD